MDADEKQTRYPVLHKYIASHVDAENVWILKHTTNETDLRLIERDRGDYALGYPTSIVAQQRDRGVGSGFITYGIKEHQEYKPVHVSCFGDAFGREVISKINDLLTPTSLRKLLSFTEEWNGKSEIYRKKVEDQIIRPNEEAK